jgi:Fe(3+) dicitrate transport protein
MGKATYTIIIFVHLFFALYTSAQQHFQVSGKLLDESGSPIRAQQIFVTNGRSAQTDDEGRFTISNILAGRYELKTEISGQLVTLSWFNITSENTRLDLGEITITRSVQLKEVTIADNHVKRYMERMPDIKGQSIYTAKKNEVVRLSTATANLAQNNSRQLFAKVPGIHVWESDGSGVQMGIAARGLSPNRMWEFNTRQNGYDISSDPFGYPEAYYTPSVESLDRIEIIRGAASLQYGAQFGGVVNYIKKRSVSNKTIGVESMQTLGSYGMFSTFNAIGGTYNKMSYYANINYRRSDGWRAQNDYNTWNGFANVGYQFTKKLNVSFEFSRMGQLGHQPGGLTDSMFRVNARQSVRERNWFQIKWNIPAINIDYRISNTQSLNIKVFGLYGERNSIGFMSAVTVPDTISRITGKYANRQIDVDVYTNYGTEIRHLIQFKLGRQKHHIASGIRYFSGHTSRYRNNNGNRGTRFTLEAESPVRSRDLSYTSENMAAFAEVLFTLTPRLSVVPGIRYEYLHNSAKGTVGSVNNNLHSTRQFMLGGVGVQYNTSGTTNVYANYTQAYRPVLFSDLTLDRPTDSIDANMRDSKGYNLDLGFRGNVATHFTFDISVFHMYYGNRVGTYALASGKNYRTNIGSSVVQGIESFIEFTPTSFLANSRAGHLTLFNSTSLYDARYVTWNNPDPLQDLSDNWVENAPQQIIRSGVTWQFKTFSTTLQHSYVGQVYTDAINTRKPTANGQIGLLPQYHTFDWSASLRLLKWYCINAGINNMADVMYATRRAGGYPGPGLLPADGRLWYLGAGVKF